MDGGDYMDLSDCKTIEEVESLRCNECAKSGHYGWCDLPHITCKYKDRIKELLGEKESKLSIKEHISLLTNRYTLERMEKNADSD